MDFSIVPYVNNSPILPEETSAQVPAEFEKYAEKYILSIQQVKAISTPADVELVSNTRSQVQAVLSQIETARAAAKSPVLALANAIDAAAANAAEPFLREKERLGTLQRAVAEAEEAKRQSAIREMYAAKQRDIDAKTAEVAKLEDERQRLLIAARDADLLEGGKLRHEARLLEEEAKDARFDLSLREDSEVIEPEFTGPLVKGASTYEKMEFEILDEKIFINAVSTDILSKDPRGLFDIIKLELKLNAAKDLVSKLRKAHKGNANFNVVDAFHNIGVQLKIFRDTRTRQTSRIVKS